MRRRGFLIFKRSGRSGYTLQLPDGRQRQFPTRTKAEDELDEIVEEEKARQGRAADVTLRGYAKVWLARVRSHLRLQSVKQYEWAFARYLLPCLGDRLLREVDRAAVKNTLAALRTEPVSRGGRPLSKKSTHLVWSALRVCLESAFDEGHITANPARGVGKILQLGITRAELAGKVKAFDRAQRDAFFAAAIAKKTTSTRYLSFRLMGAAGMRPGEAYGLQWDDLDLAGRTAHLQRSTSHGLVGPLKTGSERTVDLSRTLVAELAAWDAATKAAALRAGEARPPWVCPSGEGRHLDDAHGRRVFGRVLRAAKLPGHFTPHCLRHTYASLLLQDGVSIAYVQEQLGHASIKLTVDLYGRWLRKMAPGAVDRLDERAAVVAVDVREMSATS